MLAITSRYAETLPHEPTGFALRRAAEDLRKLRVALRRDVALSEREEKRAQAELRYSRLPNSRVMRHRIRELAAVVDWLEHRADMKEVW